MERCRAPLILLQAADFTLGARSKSVKSAGKKSRGGSLWPVGLLLTVISMQVKEDKIDEKTKHPPDTMTSSWHIQLAGQRGELVSDQQPTPVLGAIPVGGWLLLLVDCTVIRSHSSEIT